MILMKWCQESQHKGPEGRRKCHPTDPLPRNRTTCNVQHDNIIMLQLFEYHNPRRHRLSGWYLQQQRERYYVAYKIKLVPWLTIACQRVEEAYSLHCDLSSLLLTMSLRKRKTLHRVTVFNRFQYRWKREEKLKLMTMQCRKDATTCQTRGLLWQSPSDASTIIAQALSLYQLGLQVDRCAPAYPRPEKHLLSIHAYLFPWSIWNEYRFSLQVLLVYKDKEFHTITQEEAGTHTALFQVKPVST